MVTMIQERPALYRIQQTCNSNTAMRKKLWRDIGNKLAVPEKELRRRWDSLRTQYCRYKKLASTGTAQTARQKWVMTRLKFLESHDDWETASVRPTRKSSARTSAADSDSPSNSIVSETWASIPEELRPYSPPPEPPAIAKPKPSTSTPPAKRSRKTPDEPADEESNHLMRAISKTLDSLASREKPDEISAYCKSIELRMRKLPPHVLPHFQHEVDNCLFKYLTSRSLRVKTSTEGQCLEL